jgi:predicted alpha/beta-hydrolase family hydrolase
MIEFAPETGIRGWLHQPKAPNGDAILLTHGAGADCNSKLLVALADAFERIGTTILRFDLPFRQERPHGPPRSGSAQRDREGIRRAAAAMKQTTRGRIFLGGHSYGGRQSSMLLAEKPGIADGLLLLSYPLHPPRKPGELRTAHFPKLTRPTFFVHGTRDPFGSIDEMKSAIALLPAPHELLAVEGAGHDLLGKRGQDELVQRVAGEFQAFGVRACR